MQRAAATSNRVYHRVWQFLSVASKHSLHRHNNPDSVALASCVATVKFTDVEKGIAQHFSHDVVSPVPAVTQYCTHPHVGAPVA